jgi:hypothetical protein
MLQAIDPKLLGPNVLQSLGEIKEVKYGNNYAKVLAWRGHDLKK